MNNHPNARAMAAARRASIVQHLHETQREMTTEQVAAFTESSLALAFADLKILLAQKRITRRMVAVGRAMRMSYWRHCCEPNPPEDASFAIAGPRTIHTAMMPPMTEAMPWHQPPTNVNRRVF